jgi:hypothetical protein
MVDSITKFAAPDCTKFWQTRMLNLFSDADVRFAMSVGHFYDLISITFHTENKTEEPR